MKYQKQNVVQSTPMPRPDEVVGTVRRALGASKFEVQCSDQNVRVCSIPGRLKRRFWVKEGDVVLVKPWVVQSNERGDITWRYSIMDKDKLKAKGIMIP
ncbi:MAG: translation initiation factor eIF-1A [Candidatus Micrarchaeota archaeon]|nr:translation initiation factor eIF-1A [Candidatus Micrarchaeota archaeon]